MPYVQSDAATKVSDSKSLDREEVRGLDAFWRAANLSVGQIYLKDNPLLKRPLSAADIKRRYSELIKRHKAYVTEHGEDLPEVRNWKWAA
jgi:phosphoketolase